MSEVIEILLEGRIVCGHPLKRRPVTKTDPVTKVQTPIMDPTTNLQATDVYFAMAVPKNGTTDWRQTPWGAQIAAKAAADWPGGEHGHPAFSWKVTDGDSQIPNKAQKKPIDREGWPGHWVVHLTTRFAVQCYHVGNYDPMQQIQDDNTIKTGDYGRVAVGVKGNAPSLTPGVYLNPRLFEFTRAGELIISESGPSAAEVFGGGAPGAAGAPGAPGTPGTLAPAPDFLTPGAPGAPGAPAPTPPIAEERFNYNGQVWTRSQLAASGWSDQQINTLPRV